MNSSVYYFTTQLQKINTSTKQHECRNVIIKALKRYVSYTFYKNYDVKYIL